MTDVPVPTTEYDRLGLWLHRTMEWGIYAYIFALFNPHLTAVRSVGLYLPILAWAVMLVSRRARWPLTYLKHPLALLFFAFVLLIFVSMFQAPDVLNSMSSFRKDFADILLVAPVMAYTFQEAAGRARLLSVIALSGLALAGIDTFQYAAEIRALRHIPDNIHLHRFYADGLIFFLPFTLAMTSLRHGRAAVKWWLLAAWQMLLLFGTGARGAWLGFAVSLGLWSLLFFNRRTVVLITAGTLALGALAIAMLPSDLMLDKLKQGIDTSHRTTGTWGPAYDMIRDKPWTGYGFGKRVFHDEFNRRAPNEPLWSFKQSTGPHNNFLEIGFAAGGLALAAMLFFYGRLIRDAAGGIGRKPQDAASERLTLGATLCAFVALYLVRGFFEAVPWPALGVLSGIVWASVNKQTMR